VFHRGASGQGFQGDAHLGYLPDLSVRESRPPLPGARG
jgi:hypothetical protein